MSPDLFGSAAPNPETPKETKPAKPAVRSGAEPPADYGASDIEILEGLEPVRRRPGMYIGGTDINAYHHLFAEVIDNSMDEAVAGLEAPGDLFVDLGQAGGLAMDGRDGPHTGNRA